MSEGYVLVTGCLCFDYCTHDSTMAPSRMTLVKGGSTIFDKLRHYYTKDAGTYRSCSNSADPVPRREGTRRGRTRGGKTKNPETSSPSNLPKLDIVVKISAC